MKTTKQIFTNIFLTLIFIIVMSAHTALAKDKLQEVNADLQLTPQASTDEILSLVARYGSLPNVDNAILLNLPFPPTISKNGFVQVPAMIQSEYNPHPNQINSALISTPLGTLNLVAEVNRPLANNNLNIVAMGSSHINAHRLPQSENDCIAFIGRLSGDSVQANVNDRALFAYTIQGGLTEVARTDDIASGLSANLRIREFNYYNHSCHTSNSAEILTYIVTLEDGSTVLYQGSLEQQQPIVRTGYPLNEIEDHVGDFLLVKTLADGTSIVSNNGMVRSLLRVSAESTEVIIASGMPVPGADDGSIFYIYWGQDYSAINNLGRTVNFAVAEPSGLWTDRNGHLELVVRDGDQVHGLPEGVRINISQGTSFYSNKNLFIADNGDIVFTARLTGAGITSANNQALFIDYANDNLPPRMLARSGDQVPGLDNGYRYSQESMTSIYALTTHIAFSPAGKLSFWVPLIAPSGLSSSAIMTMRNGVLVSDLKRGDVIDGYIIYSFRKTVAEDRLVANTDSGYILVEVSGAQGEGGFPRDAFIRISPNGQRKLLAVEYGSIEVNGEVIAPNNIDVFKKHGINESGEVVFGAWYNSIGYILRSTPIVEPCRADFDGNGIVDISDVFAFLLAFFVQDPRADMDNSGSVDALDIFIFLNIWFENC